MNDIRIKKKSNLFDRRRFLATMAAGGLFYTQRGAFAQELTITPAQTLGPFYPDRLPLDQDNDLLIINDSITPAVGTVAWISGRVLGRRGDPQRGALVEIWQTDNNGAYIHTASPVTNRDGNFQGYGRFLTSSSGEYLFRTVRPGLYPGRTRHIHVQVTLAGGQRLVSQLYIEGEPLNTNDGVLNGIRDQGQRSSVVRPWTAIPGSSIGALAATFDIVLDFTPVENPAPARPTLVSMAGVVHGATFHPGAPAGSWVTLIGDNLAPSTRTWRESDIVGGRLPESLDGVSVRINNQPASVYYISPKQINVLAPDTTATGPAQITVTNASGTSDPVTAEVRTFLPGFFQFPQDHVAAVRADGAFLGPAGLIDGVTTVPARPGDAVLLFGTGFGPTNPARPANQVVASAAPPANPVKIQIDERQLDVAFAGLTGSGLYQFNVTIPDLADGDHALTAEVGGVRTAKFVKIRIQRQTTARLGDEPPAQAAEPYNDLLQRIRQSLA